MITNNVPGTFVMHDHLHSRGGHGVTWQIDGVPVPNSNLASSGAQFNPKDVSSLETQRGGLAANYGDRSYGVFNVVPRSGFEDHRFGEAAAEFGSYRRADGYLSLGDHTANDKLAYFLSLNGNRTDLGLERVDIRTDSFGERWDSLFGLTSTVGTPLSVTEHEKVWASVFSAFAEDTFRATSRLTINAGLRFERFDGTLTEHGTTPRVGVALATGRGTVLRASYGRFYEHPQVATVSGPVLQFALQEGFDHDQREGGERSG